jgi:hypothetical protein
MVSVTDPFKKDDADHVPLGLSADVVDEIIVSAGGTEAILIGGQAIGIWADLLLDPHLIDELGGPITSKDVDFFGTEALAKELARRLGGRIRVPDADDVATPEAAIILFERNAKTIQVDILGRLAGLSNREVENGWVGLPYGTGEDELTIRVMSPMGVLRSRISNIVTLKRSDPNALRQLRAAPHVVEAYIRQRLDGILSSKNAGNTDIQSSLRAGAQDTIKELIRHGRSHELDRIYLDHGVDLLAHALALADHPAWEPRFAEFQIRKSATEGEERRRTRIAERERKNPGFASAHPSAG